MGLLDKAGRGEGLPPLDSKLMTGHLNQGTGLLERVPLFFSFLLDFWNIKKGAFLSLKGSVYYPVEIAGFDTTSARKMKVSDTLLSQWDLGRMGKFLNNKSQYDDLFSLREASLIDKLLMIPFFSSSEKPFGLLLLVLDEEDRRIFTNHSLPLCSDDKFMEKLDHSLHPFSDDKNEKLLAMNEEEIKKEIHTDGENRVLIKIFLSPLLGKIHELHRLRDSFELKKELLSLFSSFFNNRVNLYLNKEDILIISYPRELFPGEQLMIRQIMNSLNELYGGQLTEDFLSIKITGLSK